MKKSLFSSYSYAKIAEVKAVLDREDIRYQTRVVNHQTRGLGWSSVRGRTGSFGVNPAQSDLLEILVQSKDYDKAKEVTASFCSRE
jgi:hypothetical protein